MTSPRLAPLLRCAALMAAVCVAVVSTWNSVWALPPKDKEEFQRQMRAKAPETRVAAVGKLAEQLDVDGARLLFLLAMGDESPEVRKAGRDALLKHKDSQPIGQRLLEDAKAEILKGGKGAASHETIKLLCEFEPVPVQNGLMSLLKHRQAASPLPQLLSNANNNAAARPTPQTAVPAMDAMMSAIDQWGTERDPSKVSRLEKFTKSDYFAKSYGFRRTIVETLIAMHDPAAITLLIDSLPDNTGRTRTMTENYLARTTGEQIGSDAKAWKVWWETARKDFTIKPLAAVADDSLSPPKNGSYYEIPIRVQRVVFLIDTSDSMRAGEGITRMDAAKKALIETLNGLNPSVEFNVIAFHDGVTNWKRGLLPANAKNKTEAINFVQKWSPLGKTATYDGLMAAFDNDPNVEMIFCVSDGDPSTGKVVDPAQILDEVRALNRVRRVNVHSIGVFGGQQFESLSQFMKALAEQNAGEFKRVD